MGREIKNIREKKSVQKLCPFFFEYLKSVGFERVQLGYEKENPQSKHFWKKNQFQDVKEVAQDNNIIVVAERNLRL